MYVLEANKQITTTTKWNWKWSMQVTQDHFDFENVKDKAQAPRLCRETKISSYSLEFQKSKLQNGLHLASKKR